MRADPEFLKRVEAKDAAVFSECNKAWRVSRGLPAEPVQEINAENIFKETDARIAVETEKRADMLRADGFDEEQIYQALNARPIPLGERRWHEQELARLKRDNAWVQKYLGGDPEARRQMRMHTSALTLPVACSLAEIHAWEQAHGRPLSK